MSLKNSIERLKAAMRSSTPSKTDAPCPENTSCYKTVDGKCFRYYTVWSRNSAGFCSEDRGSERVSTGPCAEDTCQ